MRKKYIDPEMEIKMYSISSQHVLTNTSDPENNENNDLNTDDNYNYFGRN